MVEYSCRILSRTRPIHAVIRGAADKEAFAADLGRRLLQDRLRNQTERIEEYLGGDLRAGLSVSEAGERYCALTSPELYQTLTVEFGWSPDRHREWLAELLVTELLDGTRATTRTYSYSYSALAPGRRPILPDGELEELLVELGDAFRLGRRGSRRARSRVRTSP